MSALKDGFSLYSQMGNIKYEDIKQMKSIEKALRFCQELQINNIDYLWCIKHPEVISCNESIDYYQRFQDYLGDSYNICKHLLLREKSGKKRKYLIIVDEEKKVDLKQLATLLNSSKLEFCDEVELDLFLSTTPGNISVFNIKDDISRQVELILDINLFQKQLLAFHPLYNGMSIFITPKDMLKYLNIIDRCGNIIDVPIRKEEYVLAKTF